MSLHILPIIAYLAAKHVLRVWQHTKYEYVDIASGEVSCRWVSEFCFGQNSERRGSEAELRAVRLDMLCLLFANQGFPFNHRCSISSKHSSRPLQSTVQPLVCENEKYEISFTGTHAVLKHVYAINVGSHNIRYCEKGLKQSNFFFRHWIWSEAFCFQVWNQVAFPGSWLFKKNICSGRV